MTWWILVQTISNSYRMWRNNSLFGCGETAQNLQLEKQHKILAVMHRFGLLNCGSLRAQALCLELVLTPQASCLQLELTPTATRTLTDKLKPSLAPGYIFVWRPPASCGCMHLHRIQPHLQVKVIFRYLWPDALVSLFFRLFTQVHLLIDGSVEAQYVTFIHDYERRDEFININMKWNSYSLFHDLNSCHWFHFLWW